MAVYNVMIVEDEEVVALDLSKILTGLGNNVTGIYYSGEEAVASIQEARPDLILMDIKLKGRMDGIEAAEIILKHFDIPVIYVTALLDDELMERIKATEPYGYIIKPFQPKVIGNTVEMAIYRHKVAKRLLESEEKYRRLVENLNAVVFTLDINGTVNYISPLIEQLSQYKVEDIIGQPVSSFVYPDDIPVMTEDFARAIHGNIEAHEYRIMDKNDKIRYIRSSSRPVYKKNQIIGISGILTDITEQKLALEELKRIHIEIKYLLSSILAIVIGVSITDRIIHWNPAAEKIFGISAEGVVGKQFSECGIKWDWVRIFEGIYRCIYFESPLKLEDVTFKNARGDNSILGLSINPMKNDQGFVIGFIIWGADISERKILERQLSQAQKLESIGQMAAGIAHEINTPLQYINDSIQFIKYNFIDILNFRDALREITKSKGRESNKIIKKRIEEVLNNENFKSFISETPKAVDDALDGVDRIIKIVRSIKEFSYPGNTEKSAVDINKAIESTITMTKNEWKYFADLYTDLDYKIGYVPCIPGEFNQAILNIIVNAAQAIQEKIKINNNRDEKGVIKISTRLLENSVEIRISDTGTGIPEEIKTKIFDPFFTTKEVGKGTGQGLAIVHNIIVKKHCGSINFETEVGKGTVFIIKIPIIFERKKTLSDEI